MPTAKIHVTEGKYDDHRLLQIGNAVQAALEAVLEVPPEDCFRIIHVLPPDRFIHTREFLGLKYSDEFMLLEVTFISGRSKEKRLALLKEINNRVAAAAYPLNLVGTRPTRGSWQRALERPGEHRDHR